MLIKARQTAAPPSVWTWLAITFLWGTVFFGTSIVTLKASVFWLEQGFFNPEWTEIYSVYVIYFFLLLVIAFGAMMIKNRMDPYGEKQTKRQQDVLAGKREQVFVSLASSIVTSFSFAVLTAVMFLVSRSLVDMMTLELPVAVIALAGLLNIGAGLAVSLLVGGVILVLKKL
ncbi:MAG: hypothetical protein UMU76_06370 [Prosthecochloris sp.]|nr:hypothetical protein [Prosthecochloris sp.]